MALYAISDLHLPLGIDKPMDIFGGWEGYVQKIEKEWNGRVLSEDTVVLPGDFSWATYLEQSQRDFEFLNSLPGRKILLKGNHDYWWTTLNKMKNFVKDNGFPDVHFLQNNCFMYKDIAVCGSRCWSYIGEDKPKTQEDLKIYEREVMRLEMSLKEGEKNNPSEIIVFTHYPPVSFSCMENEFTRLFEEYGIKRCVYGHIHGRKKKNAPVGVYNGVEYMLVSCDCIDFSPVKLCD